MSIILQDGFSAVLFFSLHHIAPLTCSNSKTMTFHQLTFMCISFCVKLWLSTSTTQKQLLSVWWRAHIYGKLLYSPRSRAPPHRNWKSTHLIKYNMAYRSICSLKHWKVHGKEISSFSAIWTYATSWHFAMWPGLYSMKTSVWVHAKSLQNDLMIWWICLAILSIALLFWIDKIMKKSFGK